MKYKHVFLALLILVCHTSFAEDLEPLTIGSPAPDFNLKGTDGSFYTLKDFDKAEILLFVFTANHCPTAQAYEDRLIRMQNEYADKGLQIVAISSNYPEALCLEERGYSDLGDTFDEMGIRTADKKFPFPYLYDGDKQDMARAYGPQATPHIFIFDKERKLRYCGRFDNMENPYLLPDQHDAINAVEALLNDRPVPVETTKTFGCSLKWAEKVEWRKKVDEQWDEEEVSLSPIDQAKIKELLSAKSNNYRLVNIWATWCGPCVAEMPELVRIHRMYKGRDFELITISSDKLTRQDKVLSFLEKEHVAVQNYIYEGENSYDLVEAVDQEWSGSLPYTCLISPEGEIIYRCTGSVHMLDLQKEIIKHLGRFFADD